MIVLDTNVLSELIKPVPDGSVVAWLDDQVGTDLWTTAVTIFEVRFGLAIQPDGRRRRALEDAIERMIRDDLGNRILVLDTAAASEAGRIAGVVRALGRPVDYRDVMIAGSASAHGATLATRNTRHFADTGVPLIDPWTAVP